MFLLEAGDQWIRYGDRRKIDWIQCLKAVFSGIPFSFVNNGLTKYKNVILKKLVEGLDNAGLTREIIYQLLSTIFADIPHNIINAF